MATLVPSSFETGPMGAPQGEGTCPELLFKRALGKENCSFVGGYILLSQRRSDRRHAEGPACKMTRTVIHYIDSTIYGGCEQVVALLMASLDRAVWRPLLLYHEAPGLSEFVREIEQLGIACLSVPRCENRAKALLQLIAALRRESPTIFHAHLGWPLGCRYGIIAAKLSCVPTIVATSHLVATSFDDVRFWQLKQWAQAAMVDRYIAVSNAVKDNLCNNLKVKESKVRIVYNGIRLRDFDRSPDAQLREELTGGRDLPLALTPARLHPQKGHTYLLEAAALVPDAIFVLAGDGPERQLLEDQSRSLGLEDRVRFLGQRRDIPRLLATCDLFVLPSLYEGMPLSVLEAMAAGKPVIATAIGGTDELVVHGTTGLLVPPRDAVALAEAIRVLLSDRLLAARLCKAGRERAYRMFSADAMAKGVGGVYNETMP